jgi:hypothetical protein
VAGLETVRVAALAEFLLLPEVSANVVQLDLDVRVRRREACQARERPGGVRVPATLDEETGRLRWMLDGWTSTTTTDTDLREPDHTDGQDERPDQLDGGRDPPRRVVVPVLGRVVDDRCEQETDGDCPLVARHDGTTDPLGRALGLVHGDQRRDEADAETGEDTADDERGPLVAAGLEGDTEGKDERREEDTAATAEPVSDVGTRERTCGGAR